MKKRIVITLLLIANSVLGFAQCSQCKIALETSTKSEDGYNPGILFLMIVPYILLSAIVFIFFRKKIIEKLKTFLHRK